MNSLTKGEGSKLVTPAKRSSATAYNSEDNFVLPPKKQKCSDSNIGYDSSSGDTTADNRHSVRGLEDQDLTELNAISSFGQNEWTVICAKEGAEVATNFINKSHYAPDMKCSCCEKRWAARRAWERKMAATVVRHGMIMESFLDDMNRLIRKVRCELDDEGWFSEK